MPRFAAYLAVICLLVLQTGQTTSSVLHQDAALPSSPKDPYYRAFQAVPSFKVTANKLMHNFLHIHSGDLSRHKRATILEDVVIVMDGSESIPICMFNNMKKALENMMKLAKYSPSYDTKYAAVTFGSSATVNFKFVPYPLAARRIMRIPFPNGATNTQAGLEEARKLFVNPSSGHRFFASKILLLVTDGQSNVQRHLTIPKANALKSNGVKIFVLAIGPFINGIDEMMKVASFPPQKFLFRVKNLNGLWNIIKLIIKQVAPGKYKIINGQYDPTCNITK